MNSEHTRWTRRAVAASVAAVMSLSACGGADSSTDDTAGTTTDAGDPASGAAASRVPAGLSGTINITGSSTVEPISVILGEDFTSATDGSVKVNVDGPGTGDGFELFCGGQAPITGASRRIKDPEAEKCAAAGVEPIELEIAFDGLTVMTNPANTAVSCLSKNDLYALIGPEAEGVNTWAGAAKVAAELGSTTKLPDAPLSVYGPGTESGTWDAFVELALQDAAEERVEAGALPEDRAEVTRNDYRASADDPVIIKGIESSDTSLGWTGFAYAEAEGDKIKELEVADVDGTCVAPSAETIADGSYPLARSLYLYVSKQAAAEDPAVKAFVDDALTNMNAAVKEAGYVPLPKNRLAATTAAWQG